MAEATAGAPTQPSGSGASPDPGSTATPGSGATTTPAAPQGGAPGSGSQSPFQHERLRTMTTPAEVERYVASLEAAVKEQSRALNTQPAPAAPAAPAQPEAPKMPQASDFWNDPVKATSDVVGQLLTQQIQPLVQELRQARSEIVQPGIRQRMVEDKANFPYYSDPAVQANVDAYLQQVGILGQETEAQLRQAYFTVTGWMFSKGLLTAQPAATTTTPTTETPPVTTPAQPGQPAGWFPPQHSASAAPLPAQPAAPGATPLRELTEHERTIANVNWPGLPYDEQRKRYLAWIDVPADGVVQSNIGREQPGGAR